MTYKKNGCQHVAWLIVSQRDLFKCFYEILFHIVPAKYTLPTRLAWDTFPSCWFFFILYLLNLLDLIYTEWKIIFYFVTAELYRLRNRLYCLHSPPIYSWSKRSTFKRRQHQNAYSYPQLCCCIRIGKNKLNIFQIFCFSLHIWKHLVLCILLEKWTTKTFRNTQYKLHYKRDQKFIFCVQKSTTNFTSKIVSLYNNFWVSQSAFFLPQCHCVH